MAIKELTWVDDGKHNGVWSNIDRGMGKKDLSLRFASTQLLVLFPLSFMEEVSQFVCQINLSPCQHLLGGNMRQNGFIRKKAMHQSHRNGDIRRMIMMIK